MIQERQNHMTEKTDTEKKKAEISSVQSETAEHQSSPQRGISALLFRCLHIFLLAAIGCVLGVSLYFANAQSIVGNQLPMPFGYGIANVLSGSMEPTFSPGTLLLVKETGEIEKGDIVVYQSGQSLVVHRVIEIRKDQITTKGDANNTPDPVFDRSQIRGKVIGWLPHAGTLLSMFRTPAGILLLILAAFLLMEGSFRKQKESDEQELEAIKEEIRRLRSETDNNRKQ